MKNRLVPGTGFYDKRMCQSLTFSLQLKDSKKKQSTNIMPTFLSFQIFILTFLLVSVQGEKHGFSPKQIGNLRGLYDKDEERHQQTAEPVIATQSPITIPDPTSSPTLKPTSSPTVEPTHSPTLKPTFSPTSSPTSKPTYPPTSNPTPAPTLGPTPIPISVVNPNDPSESIRKANDGLSLTALTVGGAAVFILVGVIAARRLVTQSGKDPNNIEESDDNFSEVSEVPDDPAVLGDSVANERSFNPLDCSGSVTLNSISFV